MSEKQQQLYTQAAPATPYQQGAPASPYQQGGAAPPYPPAGSPPAPQAAYHPTGYDEKAIHSGVPGVPSPGFAQGSAQYPYTPQGVPQPQAQAQMSPYGQGAPPAMVQQPAPVPPMQPNNNGQQYDANGERDWSHGLFDCFADVGTCLLAWFCPCMVYGQNKTRYEYLINNAGRPHPTGGDMCGSDCMIHGCLTACCAAGWILQIGTRSNTRSRYRIRGSGIGDCCASWCCTPCELTQESLELGLEEKQVNRGNVLNGQ